MVMGQKTTWKFYLSPDAAWEGMYHTCEQARFSIDFEQYIFVDDFLGRRFCELFAKKAKQGVRVRLLLDAFGSYGMHFSPVLSEMKKAGVQVQFFNAIHPWWRWVHRIGAKFLRTHRKLLVVDGEYGFAGGVGIRATMSARRDTHVRVRGPVVDEIAAAFERMWEMAAAGRWLFTFSKPLTEPSEFTLLTNSPYYRQRFTYWALVRRFRSAKKYIYITTPYFVPDHRMLRALRGAARRGVDVRVMVPNAPDWRLVRFGNSSFYARALRAGIKIIEYQEHFHHAKTYIVDDEWVSVGSSNMDSLSLLFNYEADLASSNKQFVAEVKWHFIEDSKYAKELTKAQWRQRPLWHKALEQITRPLHRFM